MKRRGPGESDGRLILPHGGYRRLRSFQIAQLIYDVTVLFCDRYINPRSRTHDQMTQAARSGVQNIAEGSVASATSKKMELTLTNVARSSLEELSLDYQDFLRQRGRAPWAPEHPALVEFRRRRPATLEDVRLWVRDVVKTEESTDGHGPTRTGTDERGPAGTGAEKHGREASAAMAHASAGAGPCSSVPVRVRPCPPGAEAAANGALSLINLASDLLRRQLRRLEADFLEHGGFTERLYRERSARRKSQWSDESNKPGERW
ncbi:MAG: four helix bundle suffix domain-containing protein [Candidatus Sumerlaeota bacterium]|nr:four helix bundle suffix domain-containing protein [Candidatus Sumerlaeota bacterium]